MFFSYVEVKIQELVNLRVLRLADTSVSCDQYQTRAACEDAVSADMEVPHHRHRSYFFLSTIQSESNWRQTRNSDPWSSADFFLLTL